MDSVKSQIDVTIRVKPSTEASGVTAASSSSVNIGETTLRYANVLGPEKSNVDVFNRCGMQLVDGVMNGFDGCLFAYGKMLNSWSLSKVCMSLFSMYVAPYATLTQSTQSNYC